MSGTSLGLAWFLSSFSILFRCFYSAGFDARVYTTTTGLGVLRGSMVSGVVCVVIFLAGRSDPWCPGGVSGFWFFWLWFRDKEGDTGSCFCVFFFLQV